MTRVIPMREWGKDHWSTLAYLESCAVDHAGLVDARRMRADGQSYPTRLRRGADGTARSEAGHSDWDCVADMMALGLVRAGDDTVGASGRLPVSQIMAWRGEARFRTHRFALTAKGHKATAALRAHKAGGGSFATFVYPVPRVKPVP